MFVKAERGKGFLGERRKKDGRIGDLPGTFL